MIRVGYPRSLFWGLVFLACSGAVPFFSEIKPVPDTEGVGRSAAISALVADPDGDLDPDSIRIVVNGISCSPVCIPEEDSLRVSFSPVKPFPPGYYNSILLSAADLSNPQNVTEYSFHYRCSNREQPRAIPLGIGEELGGCTLITNESGTRFLAVNLDQRLLFAVDEGNGWSAFEELDTTVRKKPLLVHHSGSSLVYLLWYSYRSVREQDLHVAAWNGYHFVSESIIPVRFFPYSDSRPYNLAMDARDRVHLCWTNEADFFEDPGALYFCTVTFDEVSMVETVNGAKKPAAEPSLDVDGTFRTWVTWRCQDGNYGQIFVSVREWEGGFSACRPISIEPHVSHREPFVHCLADGTVSVVWTARTGSADGCEIRRRSIKGEEPGPTDTITGFPVPVRILPVWNGTQEFHLLATAAEQTWYLPDLAGLRGHPEPVFAFSPEWMSAEVRNGLLSLALGDRDTRSVRYGTLDPVPLRPRILGSGFFDSFVSHRDGGMITALVLVDAEPAELDRVEIRNSGFATDFRFAAVPEVPGLFLWQMAVAPGSPVGRYLLEATAVDGSGTMSPAWPRFRVEHGCQTHTSMFRQTSPPPSRLLPPASSSKAAPGIRFVSFAGSPPDPCASSDLLVMAWVIDPDGPQDIETVYFSLDGVLVTRLQDTGSEGDAIAGDDMYSALLHLPSGLPAGEWFPRIEACDRSGHCATPWPYIDIYP